MASAPVCKAKVGGEKLEIGKAVAHRQPKGKERAHLFGQRSTSRPMQHTLGLTRSFLGAKPVSARKPAGP